MSCEFIEKRQENTLEKYHKKDNFCKIKFNIKYLFRIEHFNKNLFIHKHFVIKIYL